MTNGEVALFRIGVDPRGVRAKKVCDFINYWTTTDLELDLALTPAGSTPILNKATSPFVTKSPHLLIGNFYCYLYQPGCSIF